MTEEQKQPANQSADANPPAPANQSTKPFSPYGMALNIGYMIVTPVLVFGIGGVLLDKYLGTFPIFVFIGFFIAMASALGIVYVKSKQIINDINRNNTPKSNPPNNP